MQMNQVLIFLNLGDILNCLILHLFCMETLTTICHLFDYWKIQLCCLKVSCEETEL